MGAAADSIGGQIQPTAGRRGRARHPSLAGPSDQALHRLAGWYAIALRLGGAVLFTAIAVLAATKQISGWWLAAPLTFPIEGGTVMTPDRVTRRRALPIQRARCSSRWPADPSN